MSQYRVRRNTGSEDGTVRLWDVGARRCVATLGEGEAVTAVAFAGEQQLVSVRSEVNNSE